MSDPPAAEKRSKSAALKEAGRKLAAHGWWYWVRAVVTVALGFLVSHWLQDNATGLLQKARLGVYELLSRTDPRAQSLGKITIVEIGDQEYWAGELAGRRPTRRDYLGKLVTRACNAGAAVVALDFDLSSPMPNGNPVTHPDYATETDDLAKAVAGVPATCRVVLPVVLSCPDPPEGVCTRRPGALDGYTFDPERVRFGYINLASDLRQIPLRRSNILDGKLDSFAQAIAAADTGKPLPRKDTIFRFPYGTFMSMRQFRNSGIVYSASKLLEGDKKTLQDLQHRTVLIGAAWSAERYGSSALVDSHVTSAGIMPGVFLHANYAGALVDNRAFTPVAPALTGTVEVLMVAAIAIVFALTTSWGQRWKWVGAATLGLILISYVFWQNLGVFLEITIPAILLIAHALLDEYLHLLKELRELRKENESLRQKAGVPKLAAAPASAPAPAPTPAPPSSAPLPATATAGGQGK